MRHAGGRTSECLAIPAVALGAASSHELALLYLGLPSDRGLNDRAAAHSVIRNSIEMIALPELMVLGTPEHPSTAPGFWRIDYAAG